MAVLKQQLILPVTMRGERNAIVERITAVLAHLSLDKAWVIEIREHIHKRSTQQNRYLWGVVYPEIAKHLAGWDLDDIHDYMLGECFGWETLQGLGRKRLRPIRRSSRMNKQAFSDYIAFVQRRAAEHGVFIADANPEYWRVEAA